MSMDGWNSQSRYSQYPPETVLNEYVWNRIVNNRIRLVSSNQDEVGTHPHNVFERGRSGIGSVGQDGQIWMVTPQRKQCDDMDSTSGVNIKAASNKYHGTSKVLLSQLLAEQAI
ncbi:hypothetical protein AYI68_g5856 [Smittium mucronatum]|uniref:Uncharacterized protein n=1 Tax=Smittium mucronatum TaxID=133383 RepID=A0A1R0GT54_9FUNG|nr:hypothetical protein AYI68_g5856 [Smittium mucronatum]